MIRNLLVALLFFFGPALLMFMLRNIVLLMRLRLRSRQPDVIDVTPVGERRAPVWFYVLAGIVGLAAAIAAFLYLQNHTPRESRIYVPAHVGEDGHIVPGHWIDKPDEASSSADAAGR